MPSLCYFCHRSDVEIYKDCSLTSIVEGETICGPCLKDLIFVFGSNLAGRHGKGAALDAVRYHGAKYGKGVGLVGKSYALPTKDHQIIRLPLAAITNRAEEFVYFATNKRRDLNYRLTRVACGLAGYTDKAIAPLFKGVHGNVLIPYEWKPYLNVVR